jgi:integrase
MRFIALRRADGVGENTIIGELGRLKAVCNYAHDEGYLARVPFKAKEKLLRPEPARRISHLGQRDVATLLSRLEAEIVEAVERDSKAKAPPANPRLTAEWRSRRLRALIGSYAFTGARKNEVLHMWTEDVDLSRGMLVISARRRRLKTVGSDRKVPIFPGLAEILADWIPRTGSHLLFPGSQLKGPWTGGSQGYTPLDQVKAVCGRAGISGAFIHLFRHTFVTHCEQWGVPESGAMKITGMTRESTHRHYSHADEENLRSYVPPSAYPRLAQG